MIVFDFSFEKTKSTYADYLKTPEGGKYQLIDGEIIEMPSQKSIHQQIIVLLSSEFIQKIHKKKRRCLCSSNGCLLIRNRNLSTGCIYNFK